MADYGGVGGALGNLGGGLMGLLGFGDRGGDEQYLKALEELLAVQLPEFDMSKIPPAVLSQVAQYTPEQYSAEVQGQPELVAGSPEGRAAQLQALQYLQGYSGGDLPLAEELSLRGVQQGIQQTNQGNYQAALEDLAMRGRLGGGQYAAARAGMGQDTMQLANQLGQGEMAQRLSARLQAAGMQGQLGGQLRSSDLAEQATNADAVNRFNEWVSQLQTAVAGANAQSRQTASDRNVSETQRISDTNRTNQQRTAETNLDRYNQLLQNRFGAELSRASAIAGGRQQYGDLLNQLTDRDLQNWTKVFQSLGGLGGTIGGGIMG